MERFPNNLMDKSLFGVLCENFVPQENTIKTTVVYVETTISFQKFVKVCCIEHFQ